MIAVNSVLTHIFQSGMLILTKSRRDVKAVEHKTEETLTLTVEQIARVLGISRGLAYQMAREGKIPTLRFGKRIVVPSKAIERLLQEPGLANSEHPGSNKCNPQRG